MIFNVNERVGGSEVDGQVIREHASKLFKHEECIPITVLARYEGLNYICQREANYCRDSLSMGAFFSK
ncbi:hypothetical protein GCM10007391_17170 [Alteromonas halophila]|uniref:Uncharacterized protein n=1 Tax=Alteromonas halophila TaxID=516698 RepID=A0A918JJD3_9ALTE|nr:hypothetical protein GCM10007391_17170 [Alteromonas halophila]